MKKKKIFVELFTSQPFVFAFETEMKTEPFDGERIGIGVQPTLEGENVPRIFYGYLWCVITDCDK